VWGLSFKKDTDDTRESPALVLIDELAGEGCTVQAFDPASISTVRERWDERVIACAGLYDATVGVDALAVVTDWQEFRLPNWAKVRKLMKGAIVFDGRNLYEPADLAREGLTYVGIGRAGTPLQD
jgi:UDPglucose 6-dehydrogenase